jgi:hypothetical protein
VPRRAFAVVEWWHVEGDQFVRDAVTVGLLEDLQNLNLHEHGTKPAQFEEFLGPESRRWWRKVYEFWTKGKPITDD